MVFFFLFEVIFLKILFMIGKDQCVTSVLISESVMVNFLENTENRFVLNWLFEECCILAQLIPVFYKVIFWFTEASNPLIFFQV